MLLYKTMKKTKSAGGIILNTENKIVMVEQKNNIWSLPKGHLEENESELEAAIREIYEETGLKNMKLIQKIGQYTRFKIGKNMSEDKSEEKTIILFLFKSQEEFLSPIDPDNPSAKWLSYEDAIKKLSHIKDKTFLEEHQALVQSYFV